MLFRCLLSAFYGPENDERVEACNRPEVFQQVHIKVSFEDDSEYSKAGKLDLKDTYFHFPIAPQFQKFLHFMVGLLHYQFLCLPFGLTMFSRVFTNVLLALVAHLWELGICIYH